MWPLYFGAFALVYSRYIGVRTFFVLTPAKASTGCELAGGVIYFY